MKNICNDNNEYTKTVLGLITALFSEQNCKIKKWPEGGPRGATSVSPPEIKNGFLAPQWHGLRMLAAKLLHLNGGGGWCL